MDLAACFEISSATARKASKAGGEALRHRETRSIGNSSDGGVTALIALGLLTCRLFRGLLEDYIPVFLVSGRVRRPRAATGPVGEAHKWGCDGALGRTRQ